MRSLTHATATLLPPLHPPHPPPTPPTPQIFRCASGTYLLGVERHFSPDNNLVISKMLDDKGGWLGGWVGGGWAGGWVTHAGPACWACLLGPLL